VQEAVGYAVTFFVHPNGSLPPDPTFTKTVVTASEKAWFYGHPETFTAASAESARSSPRAR
jgi:hypothetical protein